MTFDSRKHAPHFLASLPTEDLDFITELVVLSGSLKDLAAAYGVSYPTIRGRLDKVIARVLELRAGRTPDPLSELLAQLVERGEISTGAARAVRDLVRTSPRSSHDPSQLPPPPPAPRQGDAP